MMTLIRMNLNLSKVSLIESSTKKLMRVRSRSIRKGIVTKEMNNKEEDKVEIKTL